MTRYIVFANRKGGCGKTTTSVNVSYALSLKGYKVLLVDVDPQAHASISLGISYRETRTTISNILKNEITPKDAITSTSCKNLKVIPSSPELIAFEMNTDAQKGKEILLSEKIYELGTEFDFIIFDPPPTVGILTISSLVAAKEVYIPMQMNFLSMEGLAEMMRLIYTVCATWNPYLRLAGVIPTFLNKNTRLSKEISIDIKKNFGKEKLFPGVRANVSLAEAPGHGKSIFEYAQESIGAIDYMEITEKIINYAG
ncbi:MAG: ParA family protein [Desulfobacterales bacterium]|nr:ParA family protein [Desulfobacterales bacterium]